MKSCNKSTTFAKGYFDKLHMLIVLYSTFYNSFNPFSANFTKWSNTLKQFVGNLATNCLSVFDHFVGLALKGLNVIRFSADFMWWGKDFDILVPSVRKLFVPNLT